MINQIMANKTCTSAPIIRAHPKTSTVNLSQEVNKECKRPRLSDLCNWEQISSFSSVVMFVYRPEYYCFEIFEDDCDSYDFELSENGITHLYRICDTFEDGTTAIDMADIMVEKNTFGSTGDVRMHFDNHVSFREIPYEDIKEGSTSFVSITP